MWNVKAILAPVKIRGSVKIATAFRKYLQTGHLGATGKTHTSESIDVKVQNLYHAK